MFKKKKLSQKLTQAQMTFEFAVCALPENTTSQRNKIFSTYMFPILCTSRGQFLPPFDQKYTGIADLSLPLLIQLKATSKQQLVFWRRRESWARRLCAANATPETRTKNTRSMRSEHHATNWKGDEKISRWTELKCGKLKCNSWEE